MWEQLIVYHQLDKKDINSTFKKFGHELHGALAEYNIDATNSIIKLFRIINGLEQAIFIEKSTGSYDLKVLTTIKPVDFYGRHKFAMVNIVSLGDIMNNYRRSSYPLTKEWKELAVYLSDRIKNEVDLYFRGFDTYEKIIVRRNEIEKDWDNKYDLLIYAAIRTRNNNLLKLYIDKKLARPVMQITKSEFLKAKPVEFNLEEFLLKLLNISHSGDFDSIERELAAVSILNRSSS